MTGTPHPIEDQWRRYLRAVQHDGDCSDELLRDLRRAFFAGVVGCLTIQEGLSEGPEDTPADEALVEALEVEIELFTADLAAGRA